MGRVAQITLAPSGIQRAQRAVNRVTEFMDADAFVVIAIEGQAEEIFLAKACQLAADAAHAFILVSRVGVVSVLRHVIPRLTSA